MKIVFCVSVSLWLCSMPRRPVLMSQYKRMYWCHIRMWRLRQLWRLVWWTKLRWVIFLLSLRT